MVETKSMKFWAATWQNQQNECAPSEDSDQPGHPPSLIRVFAVRSMGSYKDLGFLHADSEESDQPEHPPRLIWVFARCTTHFVGFVMSRLSWAITAAIKLKMSQLVRLCYLSHRRPVKAQADLRIRAVSPEPSLFVYMKYGSRWRVRPNIRYLAPLDGCACAFEEWVYGGQKVP